MAHYVPTIPGAMGLQMTGAYNLNLKSGDAGFSSNQQQQKKYIYLISFVNVYFLSAQPIIILVLSHISQDFIGQITRMAKFSQ